MAAFDIRPEAQFEAFPGDRGDDGTLGGHLLVMVDDDGRADGHFRVALTGAGRLTSTFNANILLGQAELSCFELTVEQKPAEVRFKTNTLVSKWENLEDLVAAERVMASTDEQEDAEQLFREAWSAAKGGNSPPAASLRWAMQADPDHGFNVVLQALPAATRTLRGDSRLMADHCRTVELARWPASSPMTHGGSCRGPKPLLFSMDPAAATSSLTKKPERIEKGKTN